MYVDIKDGKVRWRTNSKRETQCANMRNNKCLACTNDDCRNCRFVIPTVQCGNNLMIALTEKYFEAKVKAEEEADRLRANNKKLEHDNEVLKSRIMRLYKIRGEENEQEEVKEEE